jgi:6-phosphogluconolactonase
MAEPRGLRAEAEVRRFADTRRLFQAAAEAVAAAAEEAIRSRGAFSLALAGGSTPRRLYALLAEEPALSSRIDWARVRLFWGDERCVPPDHPDSNYRMAFEALVSRVAIPAGSVHRIRGEDPDPERAAMDYEATLRRVLEAPVAMPRLDLVLLGLGPEAHTASLFPGTRALHETRRAVVSAWVGKLFAHRITLTAPALSAARAVTFLVSGEDKALPLKAVLEGPEEPEQLPAQLVRPESGSLVYLVDAAAARLLDAPSRSERA